MTALVTFGTASFYLPADKNTAPPLIRWHTKPRFDERDILGSRRTDVNRLGYSSPEWSGTVGCTTLAQYNALEAENGKWHPITIGGVTYTAALTIVNAPEALSEVDNLYVFSVRFKAVS